LEGMRYLLAMSVCHFITGSLNLEGLSGQKQLGLHNTALDK